MLLRGIISVCVVSGSIGGGVFILDSRGDEARMRYMSGCIPLVAQFSAHESGYRRIDPPYRKRDEMAARTICQDKWSRRRPYPFGL